ncbi:hypothetical protein Vadar_013583 [Vaccinium darrowii]|uniref:Uncharacterized protein n=1 Tax=Vaccinium darrowii TaxID=229202 RepID=A0ACB7XQT2_9ERIC|nr:hypothetical protein Vadar_013583 [Vaccinium darrowii]
MPRTYPYFELVGILNQYECPPGYTFEYLKPGHTLEDGLVQVQSEGEMQQMFAHCEGVDQVQCYVTHPDFPGHEDEDEQEDEDLGNDEPCGSDSDRGSDSDTDSDYACSGLRDSSSDDEDWGDDVHDIPREMNEGVTGGTSRKAWEDLGKGVIVGDNEEGEGDTDSSAESLQSFDDSDDAGNKRRGKAKDKYLEFLEERDMKNPNLFLLFVSKLKNDVRRKLYLDVSKKQIYRAKRKAQKIVEGKYGDQYKRLYDYCKVLRRENPGSYAKIQVDRPWLDRNPIFQRICIMFDAQAKGFVGNCRPIIGLDACFLKGPYGGQMMHAVGRDANNQMYPIAMAVVEAELKDSWSWFLEILADVIGKPADKGWIFISDRQGK